MAADPNNNTNLAASMPIPPIPPIGTNTTTVMPFNPAVIKLAKKNVTCAHVKRYNKDKKKVKQSCLGSFRTIEEKRFAQNSFNSKKEHSNMLN